jgi:hypothetical protein
MRGHSPIAAPARFYAADFSPREPERSGCSVLSPFNPSNRRSFSMNPVPELSPHLKQLRLSGILDSLEARNRQSIESKLAYTEIL